MAVVSESPLNEHTTCTFNSTCVPRHSFIKATIVPDLGYTIYGLKIGNSLPYYYKSSEEENTYYILLNEPNNILEVLTSDNQKYYIDTSTEKCYNLEVLVDNKEVSFISSSKFLSGKEIKLKIDPDNGYYVDKSCITITKRTFSDSQNANISLIPESESNCFKFIMPNYNININVVCKPAISSEIENYTFKLGDIYKINLVNLSPDTQYRISLSEGFKYSPGPFSLESYYKITDSYRIPAIYFDDESETGNYKLNFYNNKYDLILSINLNINLPVTPEGWSTIGIKNDSSFLRIISGNYFPVSKAISGPLKVKYKLTKNNSTDVYEGEKMCTYYSSDQEIYFVNTELHSIRNSYDKFYMWIEDDDKKLISRKIVVNTH